MLKKTEFFLAATENTSSNLQKSSKTICFPDLNRLALTMVVNSMLSSLLKDKFLYVDMTSASGLLKRRNLVYGRVCSVIFGSSFHVLDVSGYTCH